MRRALNGRRRPDALCCNVKFGKASLQDHYEAISREAQDRTIQPPNWQVKVRQVVQGLCENVERGVWQFKAA